MGDCVLVSEVLRRRWRLFWAIVYMSAAVVMGNDAVLSIANENTFGVLADLALAAFAAVRAIEVCS